MCTDIPSLCLFHQQVERAQTSEPSRERYRVKEASFKNFVHKIRGVGREISAGTKTKRPEIKAERVKSQGTEGEFKTLKVVLCRENR